MASSSSTTRILRPVTAFPSLPREPERDGKGPGRRRRRGPVENVWRGRSPAGEGKRLDDVQPGDRDREQDDEGGHGRRDGHELSQVGLAPADLLVDQNRQVASVERGQR